MILIIEKSTTIYLGHFPRELLEIRFCFGIFPESNRVFYGLLVACFVSSKLLVMWYLASFGHMWNLGYWIHILVRYHQTWRFMAQYLQLYINILPVGQYMLCFSSFNKWANTMKKHFWSIRVILMICSLNWTEHKQTNCSLIDSQLVPWIINWFPEWITKTKMLRNIFSASVCVSVSVCVCAYVFYPLPRLTICRHVKQNAKDHLTNRSAFCGQYMDNKSIQWHQIFIKSLWERRVPKQARETLFVCLPGLCLGWTAASIFPSIPGDIPELMSD